MRTELYYFTGTGNGLHVAKSIKKSLENLNQETKLIAINTLDLSSSVESSAERVGIIYPTYAMTSPTIVKEFAQQLNVSTNAYTFIYAHCGGGTGNAIPSITSILTNKGITVSNTFETHFPSNSAIVNYTPEKLEKALKDSEDSIKKNIPLIVNGALDEVQKTTALKQVGLNLGEKVFGAMESFMQFKNIAANEDCIGCGVCEKVCPQANIQIQSGKPVFSDNCEICFSCINNCPKKSLASKKMKRANNMSYRHPEVELKELMYR